jgi:DNA helicase-2/ATP-dependent DNA helicase PcrA
VKTFVIKDAARAAKSAFKIDYAGVLNAQQLAAVMHDSGAALVIAGAGSGKTRTLTYRVARLIESGIPPENILLLTFTRKAAEEMLDRAGSILDDRCRRVRGGTFHHYCHLMLRRFHKEAGLPANFTILDSDDAADVLHSLRAQVKYDKKQSRFPQKSTLLAMFSASINKLIPLPDLIATVYPQFSTHEKAIVSLCEEYQRFKRAQGMLDFDDMLIYTHDLLAGNTGIRDIVGPENRFIMVDEYQDTNRIQAEIVRLSAGNHSNIMAVGDDAQGIYGFRGADPANIFRFPETFPGTKVLLLEENYRSTPSILHLANAFLDKAVHKFDKKLFTRNADTGLPGLVKAPDERDQSLFVTQMILNLREQGQALGEIAVLFRNARDSYDLEIELNRHHVPFVKIGGQKLTEAAHVKDVCAYLRVINNPKDVVAWNRILLLLDGIGPKTAGDVIAWLQQTDAPFASLHTGSGVSGKFVSELELLAKMLASASKQQMSLQEKVSMVLEYYLPMLSKRFDDYPKRRKDLEVLQQISLKYTALETFLNELALDPLDASSLGALESVADEAPLVLSTIHSAKGLEWTSVFLINCLDGVIPSAYAIKNQEDIDEELRILYVGTTRAKQYLFFSYPAVQQSGYGDYFTKPSRFLDEIDEQLLEPWQLAFEKPAQELTDGSNPAQSKQIES